MREMTRARRTRGGGLGASVTVALALLGARCAGAGGSPPPTAPEAVERSSVDRPSESDAEPMMPSATATRPDSIEQGRGAARSGPVELLEFIGIGRGERVADLGDAGSRHSVELMADAVGPAGIVYCRTDPRTLSALPRDHGQPAKPTAPLAENIVVMQTSSDAPQCGSQAPEPGHAALRVS
jgi:predicted methyltransferase